MITVEGYYGHRDLPDGRHLCVMELTFGRARLVISKDDAHLFVMDGW